MEFFVSTIKKSITNSDKTSASQIFAFIHSVYGKWYKLKALKLNFSPKTIIVSFPSFDSIFFFFCFFSLFNNNNRFALRKGQQINEHFVFGLISWNAILQFCLFSAIRQRTVTIQATLLYLIRLCARLTQILLLSMKNGVAVSGNKLNQLNTIIIDYFDFPKIWKTKNEKKGKKKKFNANWLALKFWCSFKVNLSLTHKTYDGSNNNNDDFYPFTFRSLGTHSCP